MNDDGPRGASRRAFLAGAGAVAGAALAGCGGLVSRPGSEGTPTARDVTLPAPAKGPEDAPVTVGVYKDFACPACREFNRVVAPKIQSEYVDPGVVRLEHYDFPLDTHAPASYTAANAARAVQHEADDAAFFAYADLLFDNQGDFGPSTYADLAGEVDADGERARSAAEGRTYRRVITEDKQAGIDAGVGGTPWVFVNGSAVDGFGWERVRSAIESARPDG
ncbi:thioredoxin domain-containing protein [Halosimplex rubrum]|uniref:Thioredoxin domain-containing protein n=1 Tax=Halosimplex rubrum TaxID=869889 RepID=A0A7D5P6Q2_9EURY|nr:thioredoxin domain-containing protein [Halosimplex rubrum]QLH78722.1 thioredoxin domain-containing protein [Halosimplex rubrum]